MPTQQEFIRYRTWDGKLWMARMENLDTQSGGTQWRDPRFLHHYSDGKYSHTDEWIQYIADNGTHWKAKCHAHSRFHGGAYFTFEHFLGNAGGADHEDREIRFQDWEGNGHKLYIADIPSGTPPPIKLYFQVD